MTASQRPERVDRDVLVKAVAKAIHAAAWEFGGKADEWWEEADEMAALGVALPLIADAIEAAGRAEVQFLARDDTQLGRYRLIGAEDAYRGTIRLVRSLGDEQ